MAQGKKACTAVLAWLLCFAQALTTRVRGLTLLEMGTLSELLNIRHRRYRMYTIHCFSELSFDSLAWLALLSRRNADKGIIRVHGDASALLSVCLFGSCLTSLEARS